MNRLPTRPLSDRCLAVLDKLVRNAQHELDGVAAELAAHRRDEARLAAGRDELARQSNATLACIDKLQSAAHGIDVAALDRQLAWVHRLAESAQAADQQMAELRERIEERLQRLHALQRRTRVLQRARMRRSDRLALGLARRQQHEADEQHLLRTRSGAAV